MKVASILALLVLSGVSAQEDNCACEKRHPQDIFNTEEHVVHISVKLSLIGTAEDAEYQVKTLEDLKDNHVSPFGFVVATHRFCGKTLSEQSYVVSGTSDPSRFRISKCGIFIRGSEFNADRKNLFQLYKTKGARCKITTTKPNKSQCQLSSNPKHAECQYEHGACVLEKGKCSWAKTNAYNNCIKQ